MELVELKTLGPAPMPDRGAVVEEVPAPMPDCGAVEEVKGNRIHTKAEEIKFQFSPGSLRRRSQSVIGILPFLKDALTN